MGSKGEGLPNSLRPTAPVGQGPQPVHSERSTHARAIRVWDATTEVIGELVATALNVFDPDVVALGGGLTRGEPAPGAGYGPRHARPPRTLRSSPTTSSITRSGVAPRTRDQALETSRREPAPRRRDLGDDRDRGAPGSPTRWRTWTGRGRTCCSASSTTSSPAPPSSRHTRKRATSAARRRRSPRRRSTSRSLVAASPAAARPGWIGRPAIREAFPPGGTDSVGSFDVCVARGV